MTVSFTFAQVEEQARRLSAEERARLVETLLESIRVVPSSDIEVAWEREVADRAASRDRGEAHSYSSDEVYNEARRLTR